MTKKLYSCLDNIFSMDKNTLDILFSEERINIFGGKEAYKDQLLFIQEIYPSLQIIEVLLRNKIDLYFKKTIAQSSSTFFSNEWLLDLYSINFKAFQIPSQAKIGIEKLQNKIFEELQRMQEKFNYKEVPHQTKRQSWILFLRQSSNRDQIHSLLLSRLSLGFWTRLLGLHFFIQKATNLRLDLAKNLFDNLYNSFAIQGNEKLYCKFFDCVCHQDISTLFANKRSGSNRVILFVSIFRTIRNRVSHCESLLKSVDNHSSIYYKLGRETYYLRADKKILVDYLHMLLEDLVR